MWLVGEYLDAVVGILAAHKFAITMALSVLVTMSIARGQGWSNFGAGLLSVGLGGVLWVTLVNRLGRKEAVLDPAALGQCLNWTARGWTSAEAILNLMLLFPLGLGLYLASRRFVLSVAVVVVTPLLIESLQAVSGLGLCQPSDIIRNTAGGLVGVAFGWLLVRPISVNDSARPVRAQKAGE